MKKLQPTTQYKKCTAEPTLLCTQNRSDTEGLSRCVIDSELVESLSRMTNDK